MTFRTALLPAMLLAAVPVAENRAAQPNPAAAVKTPAGEVSKESIQQAVDAVYPALVRIHVVFEEGSNGRMEKRRASGSGTIITEDGYILTNHHVAGRATRAVCRLSNREEVDAVVVGTDPLSDLCVLKLDMTSRRDPQARLSVASFGDSDQLSVGDVVLAMGSPAGVSQSVTKGIVANTAMISPGGGFILDGERVGELVRWIGHDAVIFPGNSGGPLVNLKGQIIGVNEVGIGSLGGAIPGNLARNVSQELIAKGRVDRSWIGLEVQPLLKQMTNQTGVLVSTVLPDSPALAAGIKAGDFITAYGPTIIGESRAPEDLPLFNRLVLTTPVGAEVTLAGVRDGKPMSWRLSTAGREPNQAKESEVRTWGLTVRNFTRVSALESQRGNRKGVLIDSVRAGGPTAECKPPLRSDDVIVRVGETDIADTAALLEFTRNFTNKLMEPKPVVVTFERNAQQMITVARIGAEVLEDRPARASKAWLGAHTQVLTPELAEALGMEGKKGVRITQILPGSPAEKAGLATGDILLKMDGQVIAASTPSDQELFDNQIREQKVGSTVDLAGLRKGAPLKLSVKLGPQPRPESELAVYKDELFEFSARDLSLNDRVETKMADDTRGVRISNVQGAGWTALAGLAAGDVLLAIDHQPTPSIESLKQTMTRLRTSKPRRVSFFVQRGIRTMFLEVEPNW